VCSAVCAGPLFKLVLQASSQTMRGFLVPEPERSWLVSLVHMLVQLVPRQEWQMVKILRRRGGVLQRGGRGGGLS
jgi:hypothetical protein